MGNSDKDDAATGEPNRDDSTAGNDPASGDVPPKRRKAGVSAKTSPATAAATDAATTPEPAGADSDADAAGDETKAPPAESAAADHPSDAADETPEAAADDAGSDAETAADTAGPDDPGGDVTPDEPASDTVQGDISKTPRLPEDGEPVDAAAASGPQASTPSTSSNARSSSPPPRRFEPPHRSRHPEPALQPGGSARRFWVVVGLAVIVLYLALSFAHSRSYRIADEDGQSTVQKGHFLPGGYTGAVPEGAGEAFAPIPSVTPPQGAVTNGNLRTVAGTYYALLYLTAGEAQDDDPLFDKYDQQAASLEAWFNERFGVYPDAMDKMSDLRSRVRERREAARAYRSHREEILTQIEALLGMLPDRAPAVLEEDAAMFQRILDEARARDVGPARREIPVRPPARGGVERANEGTVQSTGTTTID